MIRSAQPDEDWRWCYLDDRLDARGLAGYETTEADDAVVDRIMAPGLLARASEACIP